MAHYPDTIEIRYPIRKDSEVRFHEGRKSVPAKLVGPYFAVHKTVVEYGTRTLDNRWTVTHVPTGYAVARRLRRLRDAIALAKEAIALGKDLKVDWTDANSYCRCAVRLRELINTYEGKR